MINGGVKNIMLSRERNEGEVVYTGFNGCGEMTEKWKK